MLTAKNKVKATDRQKADNSWAQKHTQKNNKNIQQEGRYFCAAGWLVQPRMRIAHHRTTVPQRHYCRHPPNRCVWCCVAAVLCPRWRYRFQAADANRFKLIWTSARAFGQVDKSGKPPPPICRKCWVLSSILLTGWGITNKLALLAEHLENNTV